MPAAAVLPASCSCRTSVYVAAVGENVWTEVRRKVCRGCVEGDGDGDGDGGKAAAVQPLFETIETEAGAHSAVTNRAKGSSLALVLADLRLGKVGASAPMTPRLSSPAPFVHSVHAQRTITKTNSTSLKAEAQLELGSHSAGQYKWRHPQALPSSFCNNAAVFTDH